MQIQGAAPVWVLFGGNHQAEHEVQNWEASGRPSCLLMGKSAFQVGDTLPEPLEVVRAAEP